MADIRELPPRRNWNMVKIISLLLLVVLGAGGVYYYQGHIAKGAATQPTTTSVAVARGNIFQAVASTGRVVSNKDVEIKCKASGEIVQLPFNISQSVKKGDLLLQVDPVDQKRAVRQAEVLLQQSQAKLDQAKQAYKIAEQTLANNRDKVAAQLKSVRSSTKDAQDRAARRRQLFEQKLASAEELQAAETTAALAGAELRNAQIAEEDLKTQELGLVIKSKDVNLAEATVENDMIALNTAKQRLDDTTVIAPMDGVVSDLKIKEGTIISSAVTNVGGGSTVMMISDFSRIFVYVNVDESDIGKVKVGQDVIIVADAYTGERFRGKVVLVPPKGTNISNVVTFEGRVEVTSDNKDKLKLERTANVQIVIAAKNEVLVIPANALTRKQGKMLATVEKPAGATEERAVQVGLTDGEKYEVLAGLTEGETVAVRKDEPQSKWREGGGARPPGMGVFPGGGGGGGGRGGR